MATVRRVRRAVVTCLVVAGCGGGGETRPEQPLPAPRVVGSVDLERPRAGAPDAGTVAGHGADEAVASTAAAAVSFTGRVRPADSIVTVSDGDVSSERTGRFTVAVAAPEAGTRTVRIVAARDGHAPWRIDVRVVRAAPRRVRVPERDATAPTAALLVDPGAGLPAAVFASPSRRDDRPEPLALPRPRFRATGVARDATGGTGRIRLSVVTTTRCAARERRRTLYLPPAQIENVALPPGARAPVERERSELVRLQARSGCSVTGEVWAEATDAHGLQAVTRHAAFRYP